MDGEKVTKYDSWGYMWHQCEEKVTVKVIKRLVGN